MVAGYDIYSCYVQKITNPLTIQDLGLHRPSASASFLSVEVDGPAASKGKPGFADLGKISEKNMETCWKDRMMGPTKKKLDVI